MVIRTSRNQSVASSQQLLGHGLGIGQDLALVGNELGRIHLLHVRRDRTNLLIVGATLKAGEDSVVNLLRDVAVILFGEDHAGTRSLQRLVRGGHHNISVIERSVLKTCSNKATDMAYIGK